MKRLKRIISTIIMTIMLFMLVNNGLICSKAKEVSKILGIQVIIMNIRH